MAINTTTAPNAQEQRVPAIVLDKIHVEGDVPGNILVGNNNWVYTVHTKEGGVVNIVQAPPAVQPRSMRPKPLRPPRDFTGRSGELAKIEGYIHSNESVLIHGQDGIGKTALLAQVSNSAAARAKPDGIVVLEGIDEKGTALGPDDLIQRLFDALFESNPPLKVTAPTARTYLSNTQAVVLLDHLQFEPGGLKDFPNLLPEGAIVAASRERPADDLFVAVRLSPLSREESIQLFSKKSGVGLDETTRSWIEKICDLLCDVPLAITKTAHGLQQNGLALESVAEGLAASQTISQDPIEAAIERSVGFIFSALPKDEQEMLSQVAAAPGSSVDRPWLESVAGGQSTSLSLEAQELLQANSPRLRMADGVKRALQARPNGLAPRRERLLRHLVEELRSRSLDFQFVADELGNILGLLQWASDEGRWSDVIALGRAVDPYLTLAGLWDAWRKVLLQVLAAAEQLQDEAIRGWALHQLGTREIGVGAREEARSLLWQALRIRLGQVDLVAAAYTWHNLKLILPNPPEQEKTYESDTEAQVQTVKKPVITNGKPPWHWFFRDNGWLVSLLLVAAVAGVLSQPFLSLSKRASPMRYNPVGQVIEYSYLVRNSGLVPLTGPIIVTDDQIEVTCPDLDTIGNRDAYLDWDEQITCGGFYTITEADVQNGRVTNTAIASAGDSGVRSGSDSVTIEYDPSYVDLDIEAKPESYLNTGDQIKFSYTVSNSGEVTLNGPLSILDDKMTVKCPTVQPEGSWNGVLNAGESLSCEGNYEITEEDVEAGSVTFSAAARLGDFASEQYSVTVYRQLPNAVLTLRKTAEPEIYRTLGENVNYTYKVTNTGADRLSGPVSVQDDRVDVDCPAVSETGNQDEWLDAGEALTCSALYSITQPDIDYRSVTNTAVAQAGGLTSNPQAVTIYFEVLPPELSKSAHPRMYRAAGDQITYTYVVRNPNDVPLNGPIAISDDKLPVDCQSFRRAGSEMAVLGPGASLTCQAVYTITEADVENRSVTNTAWADVGGILSQPVSTTVFLRIPPEQLTLHKSAGTETFRQAGERIGYTYFVANEGEGAIKGPVMVEDDQVEVDCSRGNQDNILDPGEVVLCRSEYEITEEDMQNGLVTNTAQARIGKISSNKDSVTIHANSLSIAISHVPQEYKAAAETVNFQYVVTGKSIRPLRGPVTVTTVNGADIFVTCPPLRGVGNLDDFLNWNESLTCPGSYSVMQEDIDIVRTDDGRGSVATTAVATAGNVSSQPLTVTVIGPVRVPALLLGMTASPVNFDTVGQEIIYTYDVTNNGNVTLAPSVQITDDHVEGGNAFPCGAGELGLAPTQKITCTGTYPIGQDDFGPKSVINTATASLDFEGTVIRSEPFSTTVTCPQPPENWVSYQVEPGVGLDEIARWHPGSSAEELQRRNCIGSRTGLVTGETLYLPDDPPPAGLAGFVFADPNGNRIQDPGEARIAGLTVIITDANGVVVGRPTTNGNGEYSIYSLPPGRYRIFNVPVVLRRGETVAGNFGLVPVSPGLQ